MLTSTTQSLLTNFVYSNTTYNIYNILSYSYLLDFHSENLTVYPVRQFSKRIYKRLCKTKLKSPKTTLFLFYFFIDIWSLLDKKWYNTVQNIWHRQIPLACYLFNTNLGIIWYVEHETNTGTSSTIQFLRITNHNNVI